MIGLNLPADERLDPQFGALLGARWLRVVLLPHIDLTGWIQDAQTRGMKVLGVIARESLVNDSYSDTAAFYAARYGFDIDAIQGGNESDHESPSSWTMDPTDLSGLLTEINMHFPVNMTTVGPGLVSGNPHYLDAVDLDLVDAIAVHPYGQRPNDAEDWSFTPGNFGTVGELLDAYAYHGKRFWITEVGLSTHQVSEAFQAKYCEAMMKELLSRADVDVGMWFCSDDAQVPFFGLYDDQGNPKLSAAAFIRAAGQIPEPEEPIVALTIPVFERMWKAHLSNAEFHPTFGIEKFWMEHHKTLGAVTDLAEYREGKKAWRTFVGGPVEWEDGVGAKLA